MCHDWGEVLSISLEGESRKLLKINTSRWEKVRTRTW